MTLEISPRTLLRRSFLSTFLMLSLFLAVPCLSPRALAQQPDNDDMNRPSAEKPDKDRNKDKDKDKDRDRDKDRDEHRRRNEAQSQQATRPDNDITHRELDSFDAFLDSHPQIAKDLQKSPGLLDDQNYLNSHPELRQFLSTHAGVREQVKEHPQIFMKREQKYEKNENPQR